MSGFDLEDPASFDPTQLGDVADPYPVFDVLRQAGPSVATDAGYRVVTGYDAAKSVLRDDRFSSGRIGEYYRATLPEGAARDRLGHRLNFTDPPDHTRVRRLVVTAFTPQRVAALREWVEQTAADLLAEVKAQFDAGAESVDLRAELAHELPSRVISELLGVPVADRDRLTELTEAITPLLNVQMAPEDTDRALAASEEFADYARDLIDQRRKNPGDDLLTDLIQAEEDDQSLSREELVSLFITLYSAGHRTTRDLFSNGLYELLHRPGDYAAIAGDPELVSGAVQEFLRYETPTLYVGRVPTEDVEIAGDPVAAETLTLVLLGAANRDPETYTDPHRFDIYRDEADPLSFAAGRHRCLGAPLATMEAEVMLEAVTERFPELELAEPDPDWWSAGPFRGLDHLRVRPG
jgi:cytochrome P450